VSRQDVGWIATALLAVAVVGCTPASTGATPPPDNESRPEGVGLVAKVEPNAPIGIRLQLESGVVLTVGPPQTQTLIQTADSPGSLAIYGHDRRGLWVVWLGPDPTRGPDCYVLPRLGYDRETFIGWPSDGFALPKAAGFRVEGGVSLGARGTDTAGWYSTGGEAPQATFCISSQGEVTSVST
jgi:hypothetical protein